MTAEHVYRWNRAYKLYYTTGYDLEKYSGHVRSMAPLIQQGDRQYYHRLSIKLLDSQLHGLFTIGYFFNPKAHISELATPVAQLSGLIFASRAENGLPKLREDLYSLRQRLSSLDLHEWLYGSMPGCLGDVINGTLPVDIACIVLLVPQISRQFAWLKYWMTTPNTGLGPFPWIARLVKLDKLLRLQRPGWRMVAHDLAKEFWHDLPCNLSAPQRSVAVF